MRGDLVFPVLTGLNRVGLLALALNTRVPRAHGAEPPDNPLPGQTSYVFPVLTGLNRPALHSNTM